MNAEQQIRHIIGLFPNFFFSFFSFYTFENRVYLTQYLI